MVRICYLGFFFPSHTRKADTEGSSTLLRGKNGHLLAIVNEKFLPLGS